MRLRRNDKNDKMTNKQIDKQKRDKQTKRHTNKGTARQREWPSN